MTVENPGAEGLGEVSLATGGHTESRNVLLKAGETAKVTFTDLSIAKDGSQRAQAGSLTKDFTVLPKPAGHAVSAPYLSINNAEGRMEQLDGAGFYITAAGDIAQCCLYRADTYGAAYRKAILSRNGSVVTRVENPDLHAAWAGEIGIMVRNDISKPGEPGGYVVLTASPSSGYYMQWDSSATGRVDKHSEMDGYTYWPGWMKLDRKGNTFIGYYSKNGSDWVKVGEAEVGGANDMQDAGVFTHLSSARFTDFKVENGTPLK